jgi:adenosine deaminase
VNAAEIRNILQQIPKADLHVHLEGTVAPELLQKLAIKHSIDINKPVGLSDGREIPVPKLPCDNFDSFQDFIGHYLRISNLIRTTEDIVLVARNFAKSCQRQGVVHAEIYFTPTTYLTLGIEIEPLFEGLHKAQTIAMTEYNVRFRWIFDIVRNTACDGIETLALAKKARVSGVDVCALAIAGDEKAKGAAPFAKVFKQARIDGFNTLAHSGEGTPPTCIKETIELLQPHRIGHGISVLEDHSLIDHCRSTKLVFEVCPWSNINLRLCRSDNHPIARMVAKELAIVICSDDPGIFNRDLIDNFLVAFNLGVSIDELTRIARRSLEVST